MSKLFFIAVVTLVILAFLGENSKLGVLETFSAVGVFVLCLGEKE